MCKRQQLIFALACLIASYLVGNAIYAFLQETQDLGSQQDRSYSTSRASVVRAPAISAPTSVNGSLGPILNFELKDEFGIDRSFNDTHQGQHALLYFFSGGCNHCFNMLQNMATTFALAREKGFRIVGVQYYGTPENGSYFKHQYNLPSPVLADSKAEVCGRFGVGEFTVMLVGSDNNLYYRSLMNGSNWPDSAAFDQTIHLGQFGRIIEDFPKPEPKIELLPALSPTRSSIPSLLSTNPLLQRYYQPIFIGLISLILIGTCFGLKRAKGSWLPLLAAAELLLMGVIFDVWLYWPANLLLLLAAALLTIEKKWILGPAASISFLIIGFLLRPVFDEALVARTEQLQQMGVIWRFMPQIILSLLMFRLAFRSQKMVYNKVALTGTDNVDLEPTHEGAIAIRGVSRPERCDVCHQADLFDQQTGYCSRCQRKTV